MQGFLLLFVGMKIDDTLVLSMRTSFSRSQNYRYAGYDYHFSVRRRLRTNAPFINHALIDDPSKRPHNLDSI